MKHYRKVWTEHYGPIPKDEKGRSYEIHHKDGDRDNNHISNLQCVSIEEHYQTHYSQGDWAACFRIAQRMKLSPEVKSELMSKSNKRRLKEGTHSFLQEQTEQNRAAAVNVRIASGVQGFQNPNQIKKAIETKRTKYSSEELSEQVKKGWSRWKAENGDARQRTLQGSKAGATKTRGTKWYHKPDGTHLRTTPDDPRIEDENRKFYNKYY